MRRCHCNHGDGFGLLLLAILPIVLFVWFLKLIIEGIGALIALGARKTKTIKNNSTSQNNNSIIPSAEDIDRYEAYDTFFDD